MDNTLNNLRYEIKFENRLTYFFKIPKNLIASALPLHLIPSDHVINCVVFL